MGTCFAIGDKVKLVGKHRFLKSDFEYIVTEVYEDFIALEGLDYGCAWHVSNFYQVNIDPSKFNPFKVGDRVDFVLRNHHWFGGVYDNLEVTGVHGHYIDVKRNEGNKSVGWHHSQFKPHKHSKFEVGDRVDFIDSKVGGDLRSTNLEVVDTNIIHGTLKVKYSDGTVGWYGVSRFRLHVPMTFAVGDRVDFKNRNAVGDLPSTNLEVVETNNSVGLVKIKWPDGRSGWWSAGSLKLHDNNIKFKVGDLVDLVEPSVDLWHGKFTKNLVVQNVLYDGTVVLHTVGGQSVGWHPAKVKPATPDYKVGDRVDTCQGDTHLKVIEVRDNNTIAVRLHNGHDALFHISGVIKSNVVEPKSVRVFHNVKTNVMYYVMLDGEIFKQPCLTKSNITLDRLLELPEVVEVIK